MTNAINNFDQYTEALIHRYGFEYSEQNGTGTLTAPDKLGSGHISFVPLSNAIGVEIMDLELNHPLSFHYDDYENDYSAVYCLSGELRYIETGAMKASMGQNEMGIFALPRSRGVTVLMPGTRLFSIGIGAGEAFSDLLPLQEQRGSSRLKQLFYKMMTPRRADAKSYNYFSKILDNNMQGNLRRTYLDSLGKMMLTEFWQEHVILPLETENMNDSYSRFEQEALKRARAILSENFMDPPTISELARMAAVNEYKLKTGFREMFGKTVYEFIRGVRMENARHMLENPELSIGEIAGRVGYVNTSHFARAFRREYGANPREFRIGG
ncbi:MAG: helix-turn-helix transcriptional regulator [Lachnospiraceae bacterium]